MQKNKLALITLIVLFFQILFVESLTINTIRPDFLVLYIIYITMINGRFLGVIMAFNVWFVIWPNQKKALGIVECEPEVKAKSARTAMLFSRTNTLLSLPMLLSMVAAQNLY